jgi:hypothetical protein
MDGPRVLGRTCGSREQGGEAEDTFIGREEEREGESERERERDGAREREIGGRDLVPIIFGSYPLLDLFNGQQGFWTELPCLVQSVDAVHMSDLLCPTSHQRRRGPSIRTERPCDKAPWSTNISPRLTTPADPVARIESLPPQALDSQTRVTRSIE